ncbi:hypothetical protein [Arenibacter algicola]|uniref:hypothetical protein n=1 Tax=Arenibacter algicola TaxID=616991 RepID=UPI001C07DC11|nr:hypothetical protein [Arenibacter algicola]
MSALFSIFSVNSQTVAEIAIEQANRELWYKYIDKYGIINDFVGERPTAMDCRLSRPNAFGWWTPIENGGFFNGIYLMAACERVRLTNSDVDRDKARILAQGLLKLALVSDVPGFISRGISDDGKTHYPNGSNDQTIPWFFGLNHYLNSDIPSIKEKKIIKDKMIEVAQAIRLNNWGFPSDGMFTGGSRDDLEDYRFLEAPCYLWLLLTMHKLTDDITWFNQYQAALKDVSNVGDKTRIEICSEGIAYSADYEVWGNRRDYLWVYVIKQASLIELLKMEKEDSIRSLYLKGIMNNKDFAMEYANEFSKFDNNDTKKYGNSDWRASYSEWYPQFTVDEAISISRLKNDEITGHRKGYERTYMTNPLAAASIIALVGDPDDCELIDKIVAHYDYSKLNLGEFFFAEFAYYVKKCN